METIFDHDPTPEELRLIGVTAAPEEYAQEHSEQEALVHVALLFARRGRETGNREWFEREREVLEQLPDEFRYDKVFLDDYDTTAL